MIASVAWTVGWALWGPPQLPAPPPSTADVAIEQPSGDPCPAVDAVTADLHSLTGGAITVGEPALRTVRIATTRTDAGLSLELTFAGEGGAETRRLDVTNCETARRASALVIAVTIAPVQTSSTVVVRSDVPPPEPTTTADQPPAPRPEPDPSPEQDPVAAERSEPDPADGRFAPTGPQPSSRRVRSEQWRLAALVGPAFATAPNLAAALGGELSVRLGPVAIAARGWHVFAAEDIDGGVGFRAAVSAGGVALLLPLAAGPLDVELSAGFDVGAMSGSGAGARVVERETASPWSAANVGAGLTWPRRGRFALMARVEGAVTLVRPAIQLVGQETPFRAPDIGARVWAGPAVRFP